MSTYTQPGTLLTSGKVREIYETEDPEVRLMVASNRLSGFDVVMDQEVPGKGKVLTDLTEFWLTESPISFMPSHYDSRPLLNTVSPGWVEAIPEAADAGMYVHRADILPIEFIVRGYIIGSGWKDYQKTGAVCGIELPAGLQLAEQLPEVIFTPSTKAEIGQHDENITSEQAAEIVAAQGFDPRLYHEAAAASIELYRLGAEYARECGIIIADTKFEFGVADGELLLCDEVLTPDSSRFWEAALWTPGVNPPSFDKQPIRDYLEQLVAKGEWNKEPPAPPLPQWLIDQTSERYVEIGTRLMA